ncbi:hypothetical protein CYANOKiyG1_28590 [Okeania sp. KiyG1]|nr:hypothetical protein CYANOKiyG1_28590 [Okeania sp. KiyG1]
MAIVATGDLIEINTTRLNTRKINLKGQTYQIEKFNPDTGELVVDTGEIMGRIKLLNTKVKLAYLPKVPASKKPSITPDSIKANIKKLINRYQSIGGRVDMNFLEQILDKQPLEQILSKLDISTKNSICSETSEGSICSENLQASGAKTNNLPRNKGGKPPGSKNTKAASGWLDKYESKTSGAITWYFCRDEYQRRVKKTKISNTQKSIVEEMIKAGYSASQIEDLVDDIIF